jgi:class 3 adenylate cyclase
LPADRTGDDFTLPQVSGDILLGVFGKTAHMGFAGSGARTLKRKLTTIFCADAQGYSALMGADEDATLPRLKRYRAIMGRLFERYDGRPEFSSVVEAVRCKVEIPACAQT